MALREACETMLIWIYARIMETEKGKFGEWDGGTSIETTAFSKRNWRELTIIE